MEMKYEASVDEIYSLKIGLTDDADRHAIVSAMIAVHDRGNDVLWNVA